jgi:hypothetical protein
MSFSQSNHIPLKGKSFLGALELMPNGKLAQGSYRVKSPFPGELDPMLDPYKWYGEGDEQVCGMVGDAVLYLEWWIKGSEPLERYKFDWTSSGHFVVKYKNDKGELVNKRINWYDLSKYPNLVKRFELIQPYKIGFEFTFHSGNKSSEDYYGFRKRYNIMEDLGSAGYAVDYTRKIPTWKVVHVRGKEKKNWGNPAILLGSWKEFCPLADKHKDKESRLLELFRMGRTIVISYKITEMHWRVSDFVYIAKKFAAYESGKEKPSAFDEVEDGKKEEKAGDESWDGTDMVDTDVEPFTDNVSKTLGLKTKMRTVKAFSFDEYYSIYKLGNTNYFVLRSKNNKYLILNKGGQKQLVNGSDAFDGVSQNAAGEIIATTNLTSFSMVRKSIDNSGGPGGSYDTEQEARSKITNHQTDYSGYSKTGLTLVSTSDYGVIKIQTLTLNQQLGITNKSEKYHITH